MQDYNTPVKMGDYLVNTLDYSIPEVEYDAKMPDLYKNSPQEESIKVLDVPSMDLNF